MGYFINNDKKACCGCTACIHSCPAKAIKFEKDEEGFNYPVINKNKCINCGLCEIVCPISHPHYDNDKEPEVYAAMLQSIDERKRSSSGGLFYAIATWVINAGGIVFGATISDNLQVKHVSAESIHELQCLRGSKYVQSALNDVFTRVKENLQKGRWCYFVGTGCQVAGLKAYLRKNYNKLITSDLVCHGVPSQWLFDQHIIYLQNKYKGKVSDYKFRNNETGEGGEIFNLTDERGHTKTVRNKTYNISPYLYSFMYGMTLRYSCYDCKFATIPRQGDITLADYWGSKNFIPEMNNSNGVSLCLVNTEQGRMVWKQIKEFCEHRKSNIKDGVIYNKNVVQTTQPHPYRSYVYKKIREEGYETVAQKEFRIKDYNKVRFFIWINGIPLLRYMINKISSFIHRII